MDTTVYCSQLYQRWESSLRNENESMIMGKYHNTHHEESICPYREGISYSKTGSSNDDSEETISNVESVPNSPANTVSTWKSTTGIHKESPESSPCCNPLKSIGNRSDGSPSTASRKARTDASDSSTVAPTYSNKPIENDLGNDLNSNSICRNSTESSSTCKTDKSFTETVSIVTTEDDSGNSLQPGKSDVLKNREERPWLRHYERPRSGTAPAIVPETIDLDDSQNSLENIPPNEDKMGSTKILETNKSNAGTKTKGQYSKQSRSAACVLKTRGSKSSKSVNTVPKRRGRPRKQSTTEIHSGADRTRDPMKLKANDKDNDHIRSAILQRIVDNGHAFNAAELDRLFIKYSKDKHFRANPELPPFISDPEDLLERSSSAPQFPVRMQCVDPAGQQAGSLQAVPRSISHSDTYSQLINSSKSDNSIGGFPFLDENVMTGHETGNGVQQAKAFNSCSSDKTLSSSLLDMSSRNTSPSDVMSNVPHYTNETSEANNCRREQDNYSLALPRSTLPSNEPHVNATGSANSHFNQPGKNNWENYNKYANHPPAGSSNVMMVCHNINTNQKNVTQSSNLYHSGTNYNENVIFSNAANSMRPFVSSSNDWTGPSVNSAFNPVNTDPDAGTLAPLMTDGSPGFITGMNIDNPPMNRPANFVNGFPVMAQWNTVQPVYNPYVNNMNPCFNNMFNPYPVGFDPNLAVYNNTNYVGNNVNPWMQNMFPIVDNGPALNTNTNSFCTPQGNMTSVGNFLGRYNVFDGPSPNTLQSDHGMNIANVPSRGISFEQDNGNNNCTYPTSTYLITNEQVIGPNGPQYNPPNIGVDCYEDPSPQVLPQNYDLMRRWMEAFENEQTLQPKYEAIAEPHDRQSDIFQLRQQLADFQRQYPPSRDDMLSYVMQQSGLPGQSRF